MAGKKATLTVSIMPDVKTLRACVRGIEAVIGVVDMLAPSAKRARLRRTLSSSLEALKTEDAMTVATGRRRKA